MPMSGIVGALGGSSISGLSSARQAKTQMKFQEKMANTQYRRGVADLKAAGLNPILAAGGGGASAPGGAMGQVPDYGAAITAAQQAKANVDLTKAQTRNATIEGDMAEQTKGFEERKYGLMNALFDAAKEGLTNMLSGSGSQGHSAKNQGNSDISAPLELLITGGVTQEEYDKLHSKK